MADDTIVGIAVLDKTDTPEYLYIICQKGSDGHRMPTLIPVYPKGSPKTMEHQWQYEFDGQTFFVTPIVNWIGVFHNGGKWSVQGVIFDPKEFEYAGDKFRAVNGLKQ